MPNHVVNQLEIIGHEHHIEGVMKSLRSKSDPDVVFDFNSFLPMPEELRQVTSPARIVSQSDFNNEMIQRDVRMANPTPQDELLGFSHSITQEMSDDYTERFGHNDWYEWALHNWGTKWGAYDTRLVSQEPDAEKPQYVRVKILFQTAWSSAVVAIQQLSDMFPAFVFHLTYADEDCGHNVGVFKFKDGNIKQNYQPEGGSNEAMEIYFQCHGGRENWKQVDGEWQWKDE